VFSTLFYAYDQSDDTGAAADSSADSPRVGLAEVTVLSFHCSGVIASALAIGVASCMPL
jgi:hypothetical protein